MKIVKKCNQCGAEFESEHHWNKRYCSHGCYQRAKVTRRVARDKQAPFAYEPEDSRYIVILHYPPPERLNREAELLNDGEYVKVIGMNHMWEKPNNIAFVKQVEKEDNAEVWIMTKREPSPFDAILNP
jgi:hypothetical protein